MKFVSIVPMMLLAQGIAAVEPEIAKTNNLRALKATKAPKEPKTKTKAPKGPPKKTKAPKAPKSKCPKSIKSLSVDAVPLNTDTDYLPQFLDPDYWHPKSANFEIIDWEKWDAQNCVVPKVFNPPQRSQSNPNVPNNRQTKDEMEWWHRSKLNFDGKDAWLASAKPNYGLVSDETMDLFSKLLGPNPDSSLVPEALRNKLLWMEHNDSNEALVSFNRWAWRSQTEAGRPIGLGSMSTDWTNSPNIRGKELMADTTANAFINMQASPDGKWIKLAVIAPDSLLGHPSSPTSLVLWMNIYVVQEGDVFTDWNGNVLDYVKPGDPLRITYGAGYDPDYCDPDDVSLLYFPRPVAVLDEDTGKITPNCPHYEALIDNATRQPPKDLELKTFGFTNATDLSLQERWDFQVSHLSDIQMYSSAPTPPSGDDIETL